MISVGKKVISVLILISIAYLIYTLNENASAEPISKDPNLSIETVVSGLNFPTGMMFVDENNIIVLEKSGNIRYVSNGMLQNNSLQTINVIDKNERGLLGITNIKNNIFIYFTEESQEDGNEIKNKIVKYEFDGTKFTNPKTIATLPATPGTNHQGGKIIIGKDGKLFSVTGELQRNGKLQNIQEGPDPDDSGVIMRLDPENGNAPADNPFIQDKKLEKYYAYGIRNSFGITYDHITGNIWSTENGEDEYDEINLVKPGFNSGWKKVMGPASLSNVNNSGFVVFAGSEYSDPEFSWKEPIGVTDLEFLNSDKYGEKYNNNLFVADIRNGDLSFFKLNESRDKIIFDPQDQSSLGDLVADSPEEAESTIIAEGFGGITDLATSPDGILYVLSFDDGKIFKIMPNNN